jgi:hypothetical protein
MSWRSINHLLVEGIDDFSNATAYRSAARSIPSLAVGLKLTKSSKSALTPGLMAVFRGFSVLCANLRNVDQDLLVSARRAIFHLDRHASISDYVPRSIRASLECITSSERAIKIEFSRRSLQAARDEFENRRRTLNTLSLNSDQESGYVNIWDEAQRDLILLKKSTIQATSPVFSRIYSETFLWREFEKCLIFFDESWAIWLTWLRFRLLGISSADTPSVIWPEFERFLAMQPDEFWNRSEVELGIDAANEILRLTETVLNWEVERPQNGIGLSFVSQDDGKIDLESEQTPAKRWCQVGAQHC